MPSGSFQLDEFYLDLQEDGSRIMLLDKDGIECCPYPGLRPFRTSEFQLFKGREGQAEELLNRLRKNHFLAVIGSSGTGKSSLIRAGLLPQLFGGYMHEAGSKWNIAICRPGRDPIENLSIAFSSIESCSRDHKKILAEHDRILPLLQKSVYGILEVNKLLSPNGDDGSSSLLVIVDQFEELFRFENGNGEHGSEKSHFVNLLLKASLQLDSRIYVIITMRSEFLGECVKFRGLPEVINQGQYLVPQLGRTQIKQVIEGPANLAGKQIEPGLSEMLVNEIEETRLRDNLDQLPILQHALMRTYKQAVSVNGKNTIGVADYNAVGGMEKTLALHAEAKYAELGSEESPKEQSKRQQIAQIVFQALTDLSSEQLGGRRPVELSVIHSLTDAIDTSEAETNEVIDIFREMDTSFIMPPQNTPLIPSLIIDISHESLMRNWQRLTEWMKEEVRFGELYRILNERRQLYERDKGKHNLLQGILLEDLVKWQEIRYHNSTWAGRYHKNMSPALVSELYDKNIQFLEDCVTQSFLAQKQKVADLEAKIKAEQKSRNARRKNMVIRLVAMIMAILVAAALTGLYEAKKNLELANKNQLLAHTKMFGIYLRDSSTWWANPMLTQAQKDQLTDTLFYLYTDPKKHKPTHADSLTGQKLEESLIILNYAYAASLKNWGNCLHLVKEARDHDNNFITRAIFDSLLSSTVPYKAFYAFGSKDNIITDFRYYRLRQLPGKNAGTIMLNPGGIFEYYFDGRPPVTRHRFKQACVPLAIDRAGEQVLVLLNKRLVLMKRTHLTGHWNENNLLSNTLPEITDAVNTKAHRLVTRISSPIPGLSSPIPGLSSRLSRYYDELNNGIYNNIDIKAAFSDNGQRLVVFDGNTHCLSLELRNNKLDSFSINNVTTIRLNPQGNQLLVCMPDSALLIDLNKTRDQRTLLALPEFKKTSRKKLTGWTFSSNGRELYAYTDSALYRWTLTGVRLPGEDRIEARNALSFYPFDENLLLYTSFRFEDPEDYDSRGSQNINIYQKKPLLRRFFAWHQSAVIDIDIRQDDITVSGDKKGLYIWQPVGGHLAEQDIDKYIDSGTLHRAYLDMAEDYKISKSKEEKIALYKKAIQFDNSDAELLNKIGDYYMESKTPERSLPYLRKATALEPNNYVYIRNLGRAFYNMKRLDSAMHHIQRAIKIDTTTGYLWNDLANIYFTKGKYDSAIHYYKHALVLTPANGKSYFTYIGITFIKAKQPDSAGIYLTKAIAADSLYADAYLYHSYNFYFQYKYDSSLKYVLKALTLDTISAGNWILAGLTFSALKQHDKALKHINKALMLDSTDGRAYADRGYIYFKTGMPEKALQNFTTAIKLDSTNHKPFAYLAIYYANKDDRQTMLFNLRKAIEKGMTLPYLLNDPSFNKFRNDKEFQELAKKLK